MKPSNWRHKPVQDIPHRLIKLPSINFDNIFYSAVQHRAQGCFVHGIILGNMSVLFNEIPLKHIREVKGGCKLNCVSKE